MPLEEGYPELKGKEGKERLGIDVTPKDRSQIDPRIPPVAGSKLDPGMGLKGLDTLDTGEKAKDLKSKFFPGL